MSVYRLLISDRGIQTGRWETALQTPTCRTKTYIVLLDDEILVLTVFAFNNVCNIISCKSFIGHNVFEKNKWKSQQVFQESRKSVVHAQNIFVKLFYSFLTKTTAPYK